MNKYNRNDDAIFEAYTKEVKRYSLLTEEEEIKCANNIRNINSSIMYSKIINNICIKSLDYIILPPYQLCVKCLMTRFFQCKLTRNLQFFAKCGIYI